MTGSHSVAAVVTRFSRTAGACDALAGAETQSLAIDENIDLRPALLSSASGDKPRA